MKKPDFRRIFYEIAEKNELSEPLLDHIANTREWNSLNIMKINNKVFIKSDIKNLEFNQKHKAYDEYSVKEILNYQEQNNLNNSEMMRLFNINRNTIAQWKKIFSKINR